MIQNQNEIYVLFKSNGYRGETPIAYSRNLDTLKSIKDDLLHYEGEWVDFSENENETLLHIEPTATPGFGFFIQSVHLGDMSLAKSFVENENQLTLSFLEEDDHE